jgi:hypothetical protein
LLALLGAGCSTTVTQSLEPDVNYDLKFSQMPLPRAEVVHSRVEREHRTFLGFDVSPRNLEWEFELVASRSWIDALHTDFVPNDWKNVELRSNVPEWFSPDARNYSAFILEGTSGITAAQLFVETAPGNSDRIRLFLCRH